MSGVSHEKTWFMPTTKVKTIVLDNFSGELTSELIGTLNSGLQPVSQNPYGKLPFGNPYKIKGLQFIEKPYALSGSAPTQLIVPTVKGTFLVPNGGNLSPAVVGFDLLGNAYVIQASDPSVPTVDKDSIVKYPGITGSSSFTLTYGGGVFYDGITGTGTIVLGTDYTGGATPLAGAYYINNNPFFNIQAGSPLNQVTVGSGITLSVDMPRPFCKFLGTLYMADGNNIVAFNSNFTQMVAGAGANGGWLNPGLPSDYVIRSMQVSNDGRYMIILASNRLTKTSYPYPLNLYEQAQQAIYQPIDSVIAYWNGTDVTFSTEQFFKGLNITAVVVSSTDTIMFAKDLDGVAILDLNGNVLARIEDVGSAMYPPLPHSIDAIGKLFFFMMQVGTSVNIYCFDASTNKLYPIYQDTGHAKGSILGALTVPTLHTAAIAGGVTWKDITRAKLYYFIEDGGASGLGNTDVFQQYCIHLQNYGGVITGNYATQVEEFGRKIRPVAARVFTLPMTGTTSFTLQLYDAQLNSLISKTYSYAAGTDPTLAQGSMTKVEFGIACKAVGGLGLSIAPANNSLPFFVEKVEIDYLEVDNPASN